MTINIFVLLLLGLLLCMVTLGLFVTKKRLETIEMMLTIGFILLAIDRILTGLNINITAIRFILCSISGILLSISFIVSFIRFVKKINLKRKKANPHSADLEKGD